MPARRLIVLGSERAPAENDHGANLDATAGDTASLGVELRDRTDGECPSETAGDRHWLTDDDRRRLEVRSAEAVIAVYGSWPGKLPWWMRERGLAERRVWDARRVLDAYAVTEVRQIEARHGGRAGCG